MPTYLPDLILLSLVFIFTLLGLWSGFVRSLGSFVGLIIGIVLAGRFYEYLESWAKFLFMENFAKFASFIIILLLVSKIVGLLFWILSKMFNILKIIPFVKTFDRLLGGGVGFIKGIIMVGVSLYFISLFPFLDLIDIYLADSKLTPIFLGLGSVFSQLISISLNS